jgi:hypothetical protein
MSSRKPGGGRGARFAAAMDPAAAALNSSVAFDRRLLADDVRGSQAHARMLAAAGLISGADADAIVAGLDRVAGELARGERTLDAALEDIHMNVESRLTEIIGEPGRRLHTSHSAAVMENSVRASNRVDSERTPASGIVRSAASPSTGKSAPLRPVAGKLTKGSVAKPIFAPSFSKPSRHSAAIARRSRQASSRDRAWARSFGNSPR